MKFQIIIRIKNFILSKINKVNSFEKLFYLNFDSNTLPVFWSDCNGISNFGDQLNPYLIDKISPKKIKYIKHIPLIYSNKSILVPIGSIIDDANKYCSVWGSGIIKYMAKIKKAKFYAIRGPRTQNRMLELGLTPPLIFGDPALLLPLYYDKNVKTSYNYGIIPHFVDFESFSRLNIPKDCKIIDIRGDIEFVVDQIRSCEKIIASSLHGLIVANAYGISCCWCTFSDKMYGDDVKFYDYFESIKVFNARAYFISPKKLIDSLNNHFLTFYFIEEKLLIEIQKNLLEVFPYK